MKKSPYITYISFTLLLINITKLPKEKGCLLHLSRAYKIALIFNINPWIRMSGSTIFLATFFPIEVTGY